MGRQQAGQDKTGRGGRALQRNVKRDDRARRGAMAECGRVCAVARQGDRKAGRRRLRAAASQGHGGVAGTALMVRRDRQAGRWQGHGGVAVQTLEEYFSSLL